MNKILNTLGHWFRREGVFVDRDQTVKIQLPKGTLFKVIANLEVKNKFSTTTEHDGEKFGSLLVVTNDGTKWMFVEEE